VQIIAALVANVSNFCRWATRRVSRPKKALLITVSLEIVQDPCPSWRNARKEC